MTSLKDRVEAEFEHIERTLAALPEERSYSELSTLELAGVATLLHNFYSGVENILKHVVQDRGLELPGGEFWHRDLVTLAVSAQLLQEVTAEKLRQYLAFRHFFVHAYALDLLPERLEPLDNGIRKVFHAFRQDIEKAVEEDSHCSPPL